MAELLVYDPTAKSKSGSTPLAPRRGLDGIRLGLLWNGKANGDTYLRLLRSMLEERHPSVRFFSASKRLSAVGMPEAIFDQLRECDAVVNAFGD